MSDIRKSVAKAFESTNDFRLSYDIENRGASSLLSQIYNEDDAERMKFYRKPKLAEGDETKLAILYGEIMITPYIIDMGVETGINDPENITRTIRFIAGDGETEGVVTGPNGSPLENVYIGGEDEVPQPVIDSDGRPSTKDVILASALGAGIQSIPDIWDAITDNAPDEDKIEEIDPVTGAPIKTQAQREKEATVGQNIFLGDLANANEDDLSKVDSVLYFDPCVGEWTPKSLSEMLTELIKIEGAKGGTGGDGGKGGTGGPGGDGGCGIIIEDEPEVPPQEEDLDGCPAEGKIPDEIVGNKPKAGMGELPHVSIVEDNEYKFDFDIKGTNGVQFHFYTPKLGATGTWSAASADTCENEPKPDCFDPIKEPDNNPAVTPTVDPGVISVYICITTKVCGEDYAVWSGLATKDGISDTSITFASEMITWDNTDISDLMKKFPNQVDTNFTMRATRVDNDLLVSNTEPVYLEGLFVDRGDGWADATSYGAGAADPGDFTEQNVPPLTEQQFVEDDNIFPNTNVSGTLGPDSCSESPVTPTPPDCEQGSGTPGTEGQIGEQGSEGDDGTITISPADDLPILEVEDPSARTYGKDEDGFFVPVQVASALEVRSNIGDTNVTLLYSVVKGDFTFEVDGTPTGVTVSGSGTRDLTFTGSESDVLSATNSVDAIPGQDAVGNFVYRMILTNSDSRCDSETINILPTSLVIENSESGCAIAVLDGDDGSMRVHVEVPAGDERELTSSAVSFNGTLQQTAIDVADNINANVASKNALDPTDPNWLPAYQATANGNEVRVCSPPAGGDEFNDLSIRAENVSGSLDFSFLDSILDFFGGVTKNVSDILTDNPIWNNVGDILLNIGGNVAGAVVTNMIMNNSSSLQISIPEADKDVDVAFLYRGRKVKMINGYDPVNRTGGVDYDDWAGDWDSLLETKEAWTDNPAWCLLDYIENPKYGLGQDIILSTEQKDQLLRDIFTIVQYCDEIADGQPRFSLNTAITDGTKIEILEQLCSVFFGSYVFYNGGLRIRADRPDSNIKLLVSQVNADEFVYEHTTLKSFVNKVEVTYIEPGSFYTEEVVTAENSFGIDKYGEKSTSLFAFGCTDKAQALRYANWVLNSEIQNSLIVTYRGGWDHYKLIPGDIVQFEDSNERGTRKSGRVKSVLGNSELIMDGILDFQNGDFVSVTLDDGTIFETTVQSGATTNTIYLQDIPATPILENSNVITASISQGKQLYRVVKVDETSDGSFNTTLQLYNLDKYNKIQALTRAI